MKKIHEYYSEDPRRFYEGFHKFCILFKTTSEDWLENHEQECAEKAGFYFAAALVDQYLSEVARSAKQEEESKILAEEQRLQLEFIKSQLERAFEI